MHSASCLSEFPTSEKTQHWRRNRTVPNVKQETIPGLETSGPAGGTCSQVHSHTGGVHVVQQKSKAVEDQVLPHFNRCRFVQAVKDVSQLEISGGGMVSKDNPVRNSKVPIATDGLCGLSLETVDDFQVSLYVFVENIFDCILSLSLFMVVLLFIDR